MEKSNIIGVRKYEALKSFDLEDLSEDNINKFKRVFPNITIGEALKMISVYESKNVFINSKSVSEYFKKINEVAPKSKKEIMTKEWLWKQFTYNFRKNEGIAFGADNETLENIKPLIFYFIGDETNFIKCKNVLENSNPSLKKGLLIIGGYGNGKTSTMRALECSLRDTNVSFRTKSTNDIVTMYEACSNEYDKKEFWRYVTTGVLNFDDLLTEREASNYGKVNIFKDVIEKRYHNKKRTYVSLNFDDKHPEDVDKALHQIAFKYGSRAYDRLFSMFNIVVFEGKSFRK